MRVTAGEPLYQLRAYAFLYALNNVCTLAKRAELRTPAQRAERIANYIVLLNDSMTLR